MFSNIKHGWCTVTIGVFTDRASYLTDVPFDILHACNSYFEHSSGSCRFDAEGHEFTLVMTDGEVYIIRPENTPEGRPVLDYIDVPAEELIDVIYTDIQQNLETWAEFTTDSDDRTTVNWRKQALREELQELYANKWNTQRSVERSR